MNVDTNSGISLENSDGSTIHTIYVQSLDKSLRDLRFQGKSIHVHAFRSFPQLEKIHVYIREIFNYLCFRILALFNFFLMSVWRGCSES
jgi:hypothetical protein